MAKRKIAQIHLMPEAPAESVLAYVDIAPGITLFQGKQHPMVDLNSLHGSSWYLVHEKSGTLISDTEIYSFDEAKEICAIVSEITDWAQSMEKLLTLDGLEESVEYAIANKKLPGSKKKLSIGDSPLPF